jgi:hypothetical protein
MNNIELENRLATLERCCNEYKSQMRELHRRFERIDEQLHSPERPERGNPEFERDAEIEIELSKFEKHLQLIEESKSEFYSAMPTSDVPALDNSNWEPKFTTKITKDLTNELFDLYKQSTHISRLYKLAGNMSLAEKYRQISEKLYKDLQQIEDRMVIEWDKYRINYNKLRGSGFTPKTIFEALYFERYTKPSRVDLGGRKNKTRKNKVLHKN